MKKKLLIKNILKYLYIFKAHTHAHAHTHTYTHRGIVQSFTCSKILNRTFFIIKIIFYYLLPMLFNKFHYIYFINDLSNSFISLNSY